MSSLKPDNFTPKIVERRADYLRVEYEVRAVLHCAALGSAGLFCAGLSLSAPRCIMPRCPVPWRLMGCAMRVMAGAGNGGREEGREPAYCPPCLSDGPAPLALALARQGQQLRPL